MSKDMSKCEPPDITTKTKLVCGTIAMLVVIGQFSCVSKWNELQAKREKAEIQLASLSSDVKIPPFLDRGDTEKSVDFTKVAIFTTYQTLTPCDEVGRYFRTEFIQMGWDEKRMAIRRNRGGMDTIAYDFRESEYLVSIECQTDKAPDQRKSVVISYSWGLRPE